MLHAKKLERNDPDTLLVQKWLTESADFQKLGVNPEDSMYEPGTELALVYDDQGPLMAFRFHRALRVVAQANPVASERVEAAQKGIAAWINKLAADAKTKEIIVYGEQAASVVPELGLGDFVGKFVSVR